MGCDFPLKAYRAQAINPETGKHFITFNPLKAINSTAPMELPCNNCMGCKLEKSRQWAIRMMHESRYHEQNSFLTLTYNDQTVPENYGLDLRHWQLFMKKLRQHVATPIRFFACGEYGDLGGRPHYHAIIFGYDAPDKQKHSENKNGQLIYSSETLNRLWGLGFCTTQDVSYASCAYVARYVTKKIKTTNTFGADRYYRLSPITGRFHTVRPEFAVMSRRPGLGFDYLNEFKSDFYPSGFIVVDGRPQAPPKYYISKLREDEQTKLKRQARRRSLKNKPHTTMERRLARAAVRDARITKLKRDLQ